MAGAKRQAYSPRSTGELKRVVTQTRGYYVFQVLYSGSKAATLHFESNTHAVVLTRSDKIQLIQMSNQIFLAEAERLTKPPSKG